MSCCGDRRRAVAQSYARPAPAQKPAVAPPPSASAGPLAAHAPVLLRYLGRGDIVARGPVTNKPLKSHCISLGAEGALEANQAAIRQLMSGGLDWAEAAVVEGRRY